MTIENLAWSGRTVDFARKTLNTRDFGLEKPYLGYLNGGFVPTDHADPFHIFISDLPDGYRKGTILEALAFSHESSASFPNEWITLCPSIICGRY